MQISNFFFTWANVQMAHWIWCHKAVKRNHFISVLQNMNQNVYHRQESKACVHVFNFYQLAAKRKWKTMYWHLKFRIVVNICFHHTLATNILSTSFYERFQEMHCTFFLSFWWWRLWQDIQDKAGKFTHTFHQPVQPSKFYTCIVVV